MKKKLVYLVCVIASAGSIFLLFKSDNTRSLLVGVNTLLLFGVGGVAFYALNRKGKKRIERNREITVKQNRIKLIALLSSCFVFVICGYLFLPFHHLFDNSSRYSPMLGFIVGITGMLFGSAGLVVSIIGLVRPKTVMQISDEGLWIPKGKKQELIHWNEIWATSSNDNFLFIHLSNPDAAVERTVSVPVALIECGTDEIEDLIREKINDHI